MAHLHYFGEKHIDSYRRGVGDYLERLDEFAFLPTMILPNGFEKTSDFNRTGYLLVLELENSQPQRFADALIHLLSSERDFLPKSVSCSRLKDYSLVGGILDSSFNGESRLSNGFLRIPRFFNQRDIVSIN